MYLISRIVAVNFKFGLTAKGSLFIHTSCLHFLSIVNSFVWLMVHGN